MTPSPACVALVQQFEACRLDAYMPTPNDVPTIGWGSTGDDIHLGLTWTQDQADARFAADMADFAAGVSRRLGTAPTTQGQFDAMVSFAYNVGLANFQKSTLLADHKAGRYEDAAEEFGRWNKQGGKVLNGLTKRRAAEAALYRGHA